LGEECRNRQRGKFNRLHKAQHLNTNNIKGTVINLSDQKLEDSAISLLKKGLNFAVTPKSIPIEDILAVVEKAVKSLPEETAEEARQETVRILKNSSRPRQNLTRTEKAALKNLKLNTNLTILQADKGNATVILNSTDYKRKIASLLEQLTYRRLAKDPTELLERKTTQLLKKSTLTDNTCQRLRPSGSRPPRLYGLPKIHKEGIPLRPIVDNIGSPTYQLSKHLTGLLYYLTGNTTHQVKNSFHFIQIVDSIRIQPEDLMVSFDVISVH